MAQQFRAPAPHPKDLGLVPRPTLCGSQPPVTSAPGFCGYLQTCGTHSAKQIHTHTQFFPFTFVKEAKAAAMLRQTLRKPNKAKEKTKNKKLGVSKEVRILEGKIPERRNGLRSKPAMQIPSSLRPQ